MASREITMGKTLILRKGNPEIREGKGREKGLLLLKVTV
jgi:hypothetical protein